MKRLMITLALPALLLAACATRYTPITVFKASDYQWHKNTIWIKVHWNYLHPDKDTVVAEGYVEPFSPKNGVFGVKLELVGLDEEGNVVNSASGMPKDNYIVSPYDTSPFRITMKLNGKEKDFTVRGSYYHYIAGTKPSFLSEFYDTIPLKADEPY